MNIRRRCAYCGGKMPTDDPRAKYCKRSCRTMAWRERKKSAGGNHALHGTETLAESKPEENPARIDDNLSQQHSRPLKKQQESDFPDWNDAPVSKTVEPQKSSVHSKPKGRLSIDQQMAMEHCGYFEYEFPAVKKDDRDESEPVSEFTAHEQDSLFPEPPPKEVNPIVQEKITEVFTPESEKKIAEKKVNEKRLRQIDYEINILFQLQVVLQFNPLKVFVSLQQESRIMQSLLPKRNLDELLKEGSSLIVGTPFAPEFSETTKQENRSQLNRIGNRMAEYKAEKKSLEKRDIEIERELKAWDAKTPVTKKVLVNKEEHEAYRKALDAWKARKSDFEQQKIREREELLNRQKEANAEQQSNPVIDPGKPLSASADLPHDTEDTKTILQKQLPAPRKSRKKETNGLIVNSYDVHQYAEDVYPFDGRYGEFLGHVPTSFEMAVHGLPGQGKSIFCYRFAKYLADNWGRVIYVSSEEGLGRTTEQKLAELGCKSPQLDFTNCHDIETIFRTIKKDAYQFIFLDSLKHLDIKYENYLELRQHFNQEAIISIQQSTKTGQMAGEQSIKHEIDVEVRVQGGYAEIGKTRALHGRTGLIFDIFPEDGRTYEDGSVAVI